jgi:drug/metabolite transporter (DMT)-like permease
MKPISLMLGSVLVWSLFPVLGAIVSGQSNIFAFVAKAWFQGACASALLVLLMAGLRRGRSIVAARAFLKLRAAIVRTVLSALANVSSHVLLFASFLYMNKAAASTIYDTWPLIAASVIPILVRGRFAQLTLADLTYAAVGFCGLALLSIDAGGAQYVAGVSGLDAPARDSAYLGVLLAISASLLQAFGTSVYASVTESLPSHHGALTNVVVTQTFYCVFGSIATIAVLTPLGMLRLQDLLTLDLATVYGVAVLVGGNIMFFLAVHYAPRSSIVLLWYVTPIFALLFMFALGLSVITTSIVVGATLIIISNILANFPGERSLAYAATMVAIGLSAAINFTTSYHRIDADLELVAVPAGVFAILVAFMMERVAHKKLSQETEALHLFSALSELRAQNKSTVDDIAARVLSLLRLNHSTALVTELVSLQAHVEQALPALRVQTARYALCRTSSLTFGEMMILWVVGAATIIITQLTVPETFTGELLSIVLTASVAFMCFTVLDQTNVVAAEVLHQFARERFSLEESGSDAAEQAQSRLVAMWLTMLLFALYVAALVFEYRASFLTLAAPPNS